jgi:hypothetical protein
MKGFSGKEQKECFFYRIKTSLPGILVRETFCCMWSAGKFFLSFKTHSTIMVYAGGKMARDPSETAREGLCI